MKTTIYMSRHSEPMDINNKLSMDSMQEKNEKSILSVIGEERAKAMSLIDDLKDIDVVISSNYVRAMATAKYIADRNNKELIIMDCFKERKFGIDSWDELPNDFVKLQFLDENFKMPNGESRKEVTDRMLNGLYEVIDKYKGKKIAIITHGTAMTWLFMTWCTNVADSNNLYYGYYGDLYFKDKKISDENKMAPDLYKLEFEEKEIINMEHITDWMN